ncbi:MAG: hypothetical protein WAL50_02620 [Kineosporiaceae bacterium]
MTSPRSVILVDPASGRTTTQGPDIGRDVWSLMSDGRTVVAAAPKPEAVKWIEASPSEAIVWSTDAPATSVGSVTIGATAQRIVPCGSELACVLTAVERRAGAEILTSCQDLVRVRVSDGTVVGSVAVPRGSRSSAPLDSMAATPDGAHVALAYADGIIRLVDVSTGRITAEFGGVTRSTRVLGISPDGRRLASGR